jgi:hypothetical protein
MPLSVRANYDRAIDRTLWDNDELSISDKQKFLAGLKAIDVHGEDPKADLSHPPTAKFAADCYETMKRMKFEAGQTKESMHRFIGYRIINAKSGTE